MSTYDSLARLGLLHLVDKPDELSIELNRRHLLRDNSTEEELAEQNLWCIKRGYKPVDIPTYLAEREAVKKAYKVSQNS